MNQPIKAIFFDIDGTLVSFKTHKMPESTKKALSILREKGIKLFIATGRYMGFINNLEDEEFEAYVTLNGQICLNKSGVFYKEAMNPDDVAAAVAHIERENQVCLFVTENDYFINGSNEISEAVMKLVNFPHIPVRPANSVLGTPVYQMVAFLNHDEEAALMADMPHSAATRWHDTFIDIITENGSKQVGIDKVLEHYNIDLSETLSFGDGENDLAMLAHTPNSVAMGNANDVVKQHATYITDSVDEDGVYKALQHFGLID